MRKSLLVLALLGACLAGVWFVWKSKPIRVETATEPTRNVTEPAAPPAAEELDALSAKPETPEEARPGSRLPATKPPATPVVLTKEEAGWKKQYGASTREELRSIVEKLSRTADEERERFWADPDLARGAFEASFGPDVSVVDVERRYSSPGKTAVALRDEVQDKVSPVLFRVIQVPSDEAEVLSRLQRELAWLEDRIVRLGG